MRKSTGTSAYPLINSLNTHIAWIISALGAIKGADEFSEVETVGENIKTESAAPPLKTEECGEVSDEDMLRIFAERFDFSYPHAAAVRMPAKLSVSALYPDVLDPDDREGFKDLSFFEEEEEQPAPKLKKPSFLLSI